MLLVRPNMQVYMTIVRANGVVTPQKIRVKTKNPAEAGFL